MVIDRKGGFSWENIYYQVALLGFLVALVAWGLRMESSVALLMHEINDIKAVITQGVLQVAEERIRQLERRVDVVETHLRKEHEMRLHVDRDRSVP